MTPDSAGSCLGYYVEYTGHAVNCINQVTIISRTIQHPWHCALPTRSCSGCSLYAPNQPYLLKGQLLALTTRPGHQHPDCRGVSVPVRHCVKDHEDSLRLQQRSPDVLPHILIPGGLIHDHPPPSFSLSKTQGPSL